MRGSSCEVTEVPVACENLIKCLFQWALTAEPCRNSDSYQGIASEVAEKLENVCSTVEERRFSTA